MALDDLFGGDDVPPGDKLLYLISHNTNHGFVDGRKKLTKLAFFTEFLNVDENVLTTNQYIGDFDFIIYKYGPFSHDLMDEFENLKKNNLIRENQSSYTYDIRLTDEGKERLEDIEGDMDEDEINQIERISSHFSNKDGSELENISLEYLGITKEDKDNYIGMPVDVLLSESSFGA